MTTELHFIKRGLSPRLAETIGNTWGFLGESDYQDLNFNQPTRWCLWSRPASGGTWEPYLEGVAANGEGGFLLDYTSDLNSKEFKFTYTSIDHGEEKTTAPFVIKAIEILQDAEDLSLNANDTFDVGFSTDTVVENIRLTYHTPDSPDQTFLTYGNKPNASNYLASDFSGGWIVTGMQFRFEITYLGITKAAPSIGTITEEVTGGPLRFTQEPNDATVTEPNPINITTSMAGGLKPYTVAYYLNDVKINEVTGTFNSVNWSLASSDTGYGHLGNYDDRRIHFELTDSLGTTVRSRDAWVQINPTGLTFTMQPPQTITVNAGSTATGDVLFTPTGGTMTFETLAFGDTEWIIKPGTAPYPNSSSGGFGWTATTKDNGRKFRVKMVYNNTTYYSNTSTLVVNPPSSITFQEQPTGAIAALPNEPAPGLRWKTNVEVNSVRLEKNVPGTDGWVIVASGKAGIGGTLSLGHDFVGAQDDGTYRIRVAAGATEAYSNQFTMVATAATALNPTAASIAGSALQGRRIRMSMDSAASFPSGGGGFTAQGLEIISDDGKAYKYDTPYLQPGVGLWKIESSGRILFHPFYGFTGVASIRWRVRSSADLYSEPQRINITYQASNPPSYVNFVFDSTALNSMTASQRSNFNRVAKFFDHILRSENNSQEVSEHGITTKGIAIKISTTPSQLMPTNSTIATMTRTQKRANHKTYSAEIKINTSYLDELFDPTNTLFDRVISRQILRALGHETPIWNNFGITLTSLPNQSELFALSGNATNALLQWSTYRSTAYTPGMTLYNLTTNGTFWNAGQQNFGLMALENASEVTPASWFDLMPVVEPWTLGLLRDIGYDISLSDIQMHPYDTTSSLPLAGSEPTNRINTF